MELSILTSRLPVRNDLFDEAVETLFRGPLLPRPYDVVDVIERWSGCRLTQPTEPAMTRVRCPLSSVATMPGFRGNGEDGSAGIQPFVVVVDPQRMEAWFTLVGDPDGRDPRYNTTMPMGLRRC